MFDNYSVPEPQVAVGQAFEFWIPPYGNTYSWTQNFSVCAGGNVPALSSGQVSGSAFSFNISGDANTSWAVYSSTDLKNWTPVDTVTLVNGVGSYADNNITGLGYRYYKLSNGTYCSRVIGFERLTIQPGLTASANQLDALPDNTLANVFTHISQNGIPISLPAGTIIYKANGQQPPNQYTQYTWNGTQWSPDGSATLSPGDFAFIQNNSGTAFTVTFVGLVREGQLTHSMVLGNNPVSSYVPLAGGISSDLGLVNQNGALDMDTLTFWTDTGPQTVMFDSTMPTGFADMFDNYSVPEPQVAVGQAFEFWIPPYGNTYSWTQNFSVCH
jgi:hypothetical protein